MPDGRHALTADADGLVRYWKTAGADRAGGAGSGHPRPMKPALWLGRSLAPLVIMQAQLPASEVA